MARIRTIKPEFFTSEDIVALSPMARLLYVALWCESDREGRMQWKPRTFKLRYFPADACDIEALCAELIAARLVVLYEDGALAFIPAFGRHQHINPRESASSLPDPDRISVTSSNEVDASPRVSDAQGGRERKGREGGIQEPYGSVASKPATARPPPDAGLPPDPADQGDPPLGADDPAEPVRERLRAEPAAGPPCPFARVVAVYHEALPELPRVRLMDERRRRAIGRVWRWVLASKKPDGSARADTADEALAWLKNFFETARENDFLMGRGGRSNGHENWRCDLDFLLTDKGMRHVIEKTEVAA